VVKLVGIILPSLLGFAVLITLIVAAVWYLRKGGYLALTSYRFQVFGDDGDDGNNTLLTCLFFPYL